MAGTPRSVAIVATSIHRWYDDMALPSIDVGQSISMSNGNT
ncbi:Uncharacterised protein [Mycobacteroides abscessus subsp. abscessus]|nr:Uncharacterised protein [Mycobacteroides abscessus subsp. abscessus]